MFLEDLVFVKGSISPSCSSSSHFTGPHPNQSKLYSLNTYTKTSFKILISRTRALKIFITPGMCTQRPCAPEIAKVRVSVCVCGVFVCVSVCPPLRTLITSGRIWCDIGRV